MTMYYCHKCRQRCNVTTSDPGAEVRCVRCRDSFVEELQTAEETEEHPPRVGNIPLFPGAGAGGENPFGMFPGSPFSRLFSHITGISAGGGGGGSGGSGNASNTSRPRQPQSGGRFQSNQPQGEQSQSGGIRSGGSSQQNATAQPGGGAEEEDPMANFIGNIFASLVAHNQRGEQSPSTASEGSASPPAQFSFIHVTRGPAHGGEQAIFGINPNLQDYAWGPNGLDNVLTALLNQFDDAQERNRALRPEDIQRLPIIKVTKEHVDKGTQCTTCMETFTLGEDVAKLNCKHIFHRDCLVPWLQRKNTCPICRTTIDPKDWGPRITDVDELD